MSSIVQGFGEGPGDPHQALVDAVHVGGSSALASTLGDQAFVLRELTLRPQVLFTPGDAESVSFTEVVGRIHELRSALDALEARAVVALADSLTLQKQAEVRAHAAQEVDQVPPTKKLLREAASEAAREVSMKIGKSPASAAHSLASQRRLVADMPEMLTALADAQITSTVAHRTARSFAPLSSAQRAEADHLLGQRLPDLDAAGSEAWDDAAAAAIAQADPFGQKRRHQRAMQERNVTVRRAEHGMATVSARVSGLDGAKIRKRLSLEAERLRASGDRRGHQAIQADSFVDTLIGRENGMEPVTLDIGIMITDRALIHPTGGDLVQIEGYGAAPAEVLRDELRGPLGIALTRETEEAMGPDGPALRAVMRRLYTHPRTGELVAVESRARAFPAALAKFIRWRDRICRGPYCDAAIRQSDHVHPHASGGSTSLDNGQGLCAYCNGKEGQTRSVQRVGDPATDGHTVEWVSGTGTRRVSRPPALTTPEQPPVQEALRRAVAPPARTGRPAWLTWPARPARPARPTWQAWPARPARSIGQARPARSRRPARTSPVARPTRAIFRAVRTRARRSPARRGPWRTRQPQWSRSPDSSP
ncbi:HNH endonuclease [Brachybacterium paraconglomeratum]|uniref:HNH endonuclease n=1 Tax=Brachybacterium paraconglomeratum TaxID=173362 RepID=UPI0031F07B18